MAEEDQKSCEEPGCLELGAPCRVEDDDEPEYFCSEHAFQAGYCYCCGSFWGGIVEFDFAKIRGVCPHCRDQILADTCDPEPDEDYEPELEDLPYELSCD